MLAKDLAKILMETPDAEVLMEKWDSEGGFYDFFLAEVRACDIGVNNTELYENALINRQEGVIVITDGQFIGSESY